MMGHAVLALYLKHKIKTSALDTYRWCKIVIHQTRVYLLKEYLHWKEDIKYFWKTVAEDVEPRWKRYRLKPISELFNEDKPIETHFSVSDRMGVGKQPIRKPPVECEGDELEEDRYRDCIICRLRPGFQGAFFCLFILYGRLWE
jgi:hypothetical protein